MRTLIKNAKIYTTIAPVINGWLLAEDKKIKKFQEGETTPEIEQSCDKVVDASGKSLIPGFIDLHTHGSLGHCTMDADPDAIIEMAERNAKHGVIGFLPTTMTENRENTIKAIKAASSLVGKRGNFSKILGVHLEGPYFSPKKAGAQDPNNIRRADIDEIKDFLAAGVVKLVAMAPEYPENIKAAEFLSQNGVTVAAGHSNATYEELLLGSQHGFTEVTHLFNGMSAFSHRAPGMIGGALTIPSLSCEMICDNVHSHPAAQNLAWRAKGKERIILITDSIRPSGLPDGTYDTVSGTFVVSENGTNLRLPSGTLAGSALTMDRALKNFTTNAASTLEETWRCSSLNAAISLGISSETGSIENGKLADLVLLDETFKVCMTMIEGKIVFEE